MPAGAYVFHSAAGVVAVHGESGGPNALVLRRGEYRREAPTTGILEFNRYGGTYFLVKVFEPGAHEGSGLPRTARETAIAKRLGPTQTTRILLKRN